MNPVRFIAFLALIVTTPLFAADHDAPRGIEPSLPGDRLYIDATESKAGKSAAQRSEPPGYRAEKHP
jgi:hypothetical protein